MNNQIVHNNDSTGNLLEAGRATKSNLDSSSTIPRKYKVIIIVTGILATVAICAVVAIAVGLSLPFKFHTQSYHYDTEQHVDQMEHDMEAEYKTIAKRQTMNGRPVKNCYSDESNETYPAARIAGRGFKWTTNEPGSQNSPQISGYQSFWVCANKSGAFVDGGMFFIHEDRTLNVPTCGYYQVSSHVYFQSDPTASTSSSNYVRHELIIKKNCPYAHESDIVILRSYSSLVSTSTSYGRTSTHIGDVVKMCKGGTIQVNIPNDSSNSCCPYGRSQSTYLSAFLVSNTSCSASIPQITPPN